MSQVVDFLNEAKTYYIATVEEGQPRVRPFGAAAEHDGKVYLGTYKKKKVYQQLLANPKTEVSGMAKGKWIRLSGEAVFDESVEAKQAMFDANPELKNMYRMDDENVVVFYFKDMKATVYSFSGETVELED
ncbi:pyridoxamine 5'-phosphate oxidase family protein [Escherichia coli]|uniref:pyridoxamine 5'-phosphate oxidase family protein n=1 Tax=Escherichia coli TaxID=562 RepID=UPI0007E3C872|nr:pyridoxamine 5'-phosphate oxidase family protein [Escherichia coli]EAX6368084.1 NimC/NimA family protein [Salmonella enterica]EDW4229152.1 NimC/NimA family protein [Salmonella enterica subsp. enterica serovar 4,[5],12:i:-]EEE1136133.1 NimC/NimA family protein [Salmonella enterica subsp. enterica serovar 4,[5],12:i:-]PBQ70403.1 NimC/NimA family protein [Escherichia coli]QFH28510.1 NimC/NimA family protein [Escherichia coli]